METDSREFRPKTPPGLLVFVFLLSLSSIAFEITLARVFAISQWNHMAFMVISVALLGFAAGGVLLCIQQIRERPWYRRTATNKPFRQVSLLFALTTVSALLWLSQIPIDYFRLPLEPIQALYLLAAYLLLALPFFCAGLVIALAYIVQPHKSGHVYFATMSGSAAGALLPFPLLPLLGEAGLILVLALLPVIPVLLQRSAMGERPLPEVMPPKHPSTLLNTVALLVLTTSAVLVFSDHTVTPLRPSPYKALSQQLMLPDTHISNTYHSLRGRYDVIKGPYIRYAPGLSLQYNRPLPLQSAFFKDGDNQITLYSGPLAQMKHFAASTLSFCGYRLVPNAENILVILHNGGTSLPNAMASGASHITVLAKDPLAARLLAAHYDLPVIPQNPRVFLTRTDRSFDLIHLEDWGASLPGASALSEANTLTVDAFERYLKRLKPRGLFLIARKLLLPPSDSLRLWATAYEALKKFGATRPEGHIALLRTWDTYVLLTSPQPLNSPRTLERFAEQLNFDVVYLPEISARQANRHNVFSAPFHYTALQNLKKAYHDGRAATFFDDYLLDVAPQSDVRPFPGRLLKWSKIRQYYQAMGRRIYTLLLSGEVVVVVVLIEALIVSMSLLILPLFFMRRDNAALSLPALLFFLSVGFGFMFVELFFINCYTLFFNEAVVSFTLVLAGILISSSVGGYVSQRLGCTGLSYSMAGLVGILCGVGLTQEYWSAFYLGVADGWRHLLSLVLLFPVGFLLGLPFPLGMRLLMPNSTQRAHAWAVNGCASVVTSVAAMQLAISIGLPALLGGAVVAYLIAIAALHALK